MNEYLEKFRQKINEKGYFYANRNNNLLAVARYAKIYEISFDEYSSEVRNGFGSDYTESDKRTMKNAWDKAQKDGSIETISSFKSAKNDFDSIKYAKGIISQEKSISEDQKLVDNQCMFVDYLKSINNKYVEKIKENVSKCKEFEEDSSFLKNLYSENDLVWMSNNPVVEDIHSEVKDIKAFADSKSSLKYLNYLSINPLKDDTNRSDKNIREFKYLLLESDELPKIDQISLLYDMIENGVPIKMIVFTGNKSYHALVKVNGVNSKDEWDEYVNDIFGRLNSIPSPNNGELFDEHCKNPSRLSRLPFAIRNDEKTDWDDKKQILMYLQTDDQMLTNDARSSISNWCDKILNKQNDIILASSEDEIKCKDEVSEDELLYLFKDNDDILNIWNDGRHIHTLFKVQDYDNEGKLTYSVIDKKWDNEKFFYDEISRRLNKIYGVDFQMKSLKTLKINFKNEVKTPFVGEKDCIRKGVVNTFIPGWLGKIINDDSVPSELNEKLEMMLNNIFGDDLEARTWTLQWMRNFMHTFNAITAPVFWEIPGTGKTMFTKAFGEAIGDWIKTPCKKDDIQFNEWLNHTVIIFEESSSGSKREGKDLGDLLKDWITEKEKTIESKGRDPIKKTIKSCYLFNANVNNSVPPVFIEENDRRYTIIKNDNAVNLIDLWNAEDFKHWDSGEWQKQLMKWIYNLPIDKSVDIRRGLNSDMKNQIVQMNKSNLEVAIDQMVKLLVENHRGWVSCKDLMDTIKNDYGVNTSTRAIGNILNELGFKSGIRRFNGEVKRGYVFDAEVIEDDQENAGTANDNHSSLFED